MKFIFAAAAVAFLLCGCSTTDTKNEKKEPVASKPKKVNRAWADLQKDLMNRRDPNRGDVNTLQNDNFRVFPGRSGRRSEELYDNKDQSIYGGLGL